MCNNYYLDFLRANKFHKTLVLLLLSYFFGIGVLFAQTNNLNLIKGIINNTSLPDSTKIFEIDSIIFNQILFSEPDSAIYFAQLEYDFSTKYNFPKYMSFAKNMKGVAYRIKGYYVKAIAYAIETLPIR